MAARQQLTPGGSIPRPMVYTALSDQLVEQARHGEARALAEDTLMRRTARRGRELGGGGDGTGDS